MADEDLRSTIVQAVRRMKPALEITTVVELGLASATDPEILDFAWQEQFLVISHDVNTMKAEADKRIIDGSGIHGLFLVPQRRAIKPVAECIVLIWSASKTEEWHDRIVYLPF